MNKWRKILQRVFAVDKTPPQTRQGRKSKGFMQPRTRRWH